VVGLSHCLVVGQRGRSLVIVNIDRRGHQTYSQVANCIVDYCSVVVAALGSVGCSCTVLARVLLCTHKVSACLKIVRHFYRAMRCAIVQSAVLRLHVVRLSVK